jgi:hypothetical protein
MTHFTVYIRGLVAVQFVHVPVPIKVRHHFYWYKYRCHACRILSTGSGTISTDDNYDVAACIGTSTPPVLLIPVKLVRTISFFTGGSNNYHKLLLPPVHFGTFSTRILLVDCCLALTLLLVSPQYAFC